MGADWEESNSVNEPDIPQRPHQNKCPLPTLIICAAWEWPLLLTTQSVHLTADLGVHQEGYA